MNVLEEVGEDGKSIIVGDFVRMSWVRMVGVENAEPRKEKEWSLL